MEEAHKQGHHHDAWRAAVDLDLAEDAGPRVPVFVLQAAAAGSVLPSAQHAPETVAPLVVVDLLLLRRRKEKREKRGKFRGARGCAGIQDQIVQCIYCGRGRLRTNSIQFNSIQFNSKGTQLTVMQQSLPSSLPSQQQHALMAFLQHMCSHTC